MHINPLQHIPTRHNLKVPLQHIPTTLLDITSKFHINDFLETMNIQKHVTHKVYKYIHDLCPQRINS